MNEKIKRLVVCALMAAFTCVATMIIKFPTPTFGYIHLGDSLVLLCGIVLGPLTGGLAAGIGSMFSDIFAGYVSYAPATLIIKALTAALAGCLFHKSFRKIASRNLRVIASGLLGETVMVLGYFLYEVFLAAFATGSINQASLAAGVASSAVGIPFKIVQAVVGIIICVGILPILLKIDTIRDWIVN